MESLVMQSAVIAKIKFQTLIDVEHLIPPLRMNTVSSVVPRLNASICLLRHSDPVVPPPEYESDSAQ